MLSALIREHGGLDRLLLEEGEIPRPKAGEALLRIRYSALNRLDLFVLRGMPGMPLPLPMVPGSDMAGEIVQLGPQGRGEDPAASPLKVGDPVAVYPVSFCARCAACRRGEEHLCSEFGIFGETEDGGHREYACVPLRNLVKLPSHELLPAAAAAGLTYLTVHEMLFRKISLHSEQSVLVLAGSSGIGTAAIQLAKRAGCRVIATAGSAEKEAYAAAQGADHTVNHYEDPDWFRTVRKLTDSKGVDVVVEHPGSPTFPNSLKCLARAGSLITCGAGAGPYIEMDLRHLFIKQQRIIGSSMGPLSSFIDIMTLLSEGKIQPRIHNVYSLKFVQTAYKVLTDSRHQGKLLLEMS